MAELGEGEGRESHWRGEWWTRKGEWAIGEEGGERERGKGGETKRGLVTCQCHVPRRNDEWVINLPPHHLNEVKSLQGLKPNKNI